MHNPIMEKVRISDVRLIRFMPGDDLFEKLHKRIYELGWFRAIILSCVGSLKGASFRNAKSQADLPIILAEKTNQSDENMPCEILSIQGNVFPKNGEIIIHLHGIIGQPDGSTRGGHMLKATVFTTCEMVIAKIDGSKAARKKSDITGLDELHTPEGAL